MTKKLKNKQIFCVFFLLVCYLMCLYHDKCSTAMLPRDAIFIFNVWKMSVVSLVVCFFLPFFSGLIVTLSHFNHNSVASCVFVEFSTFRSVFCIKLRAYFPCHVSSFLSQSECEWKAQIEHILLMNLLTWATRFFYSLSNVF